MNSDFLLLETTSFFLSCSSDVDFLLESVESSIEFISLTNSSRRPDAAAEKPACGETMFSRSKSLSFTSAEIAGIKENIIQTEIADKIIFLFIFSSFVH